MSKAQSALEYLVTYGWALFVIIVAVAVIYSIIKPNLMTPTRCELGVGFQCNSYKIGRGDAGLTLILNQAVAPSITITQAGCTAQSVDSYVEDLDNPITLLQGVPLAVAGGNSTNVVRCLDASGNEFSPGDDFNVFYTGKVCVTYHQTGTETNHTACGALSALVE